MGTQSTVNTAVISAGGTLVVRELFSQLSPVVGLANGANGSQLRARTRLAVAAKEIKSISGGAAATATAAVPFLLSPRTGACVTCCGNKCRLCETTTARPQVPLIWPRLVEMRALRSLLLR